MKIGKYISELLFENDFVILPNLGEFSTKYIPAKFIPELKKVESPSKVITFNEKNKSGGGLLTEYIARKENMLSQQAKEFVNNFVEEMHNSLKSGKKVELESVGVFSLDQSGTLLFEPDTSINYLNDSLGLSSVKEPEKKSEAEAKSELDKVLENISKDDDVIEPKPVVEVNPVVVPDDNREIIEETPNPPPVEPEESKKTQPVASAVKRPVVMPVRPVQEPVSKNRVSSSANKESGTSVNKGGLPPAMKWVAFTVVPLLIIIIILALNYEYIFGEKSVFFGKERPVEVTRTEAPAPVTPQETTTPEPVVAQDTYDPTVVPAQPERGRPVYYIIVGSFEEEHSAMILAEELRVKGARTASVFPINRLGFYRVYYGYYYDLREAERELQQAQEVNPQSWILHR